MLNSHPAQPFAVVLRQELDTDTWTHLDIMVAFCRVSGLDLINDHLVQFIEQGGACLLYTSPSPRDATLSRMPSSA